jgi:hypothetical protein
MAALGGVMSIWNKLHHLFDEDDGSLPDIFVEGISPEESVEIYSWVLSLTKPYGEPCLWSLEEEKDIRIVDIPNPALYYIQGKAESFRHGLEVFSFNGVEIPQLSICIGKSGVEFDYRMGKNWGPKELIALFDLLIQIKRVAPNAKITQAYEGGYHRQNNEFSIVFEEYVNEHSSS